MRAVAAVLFVLFTAPALAQTLTVPSDPIVHGAIEGYLRPGFLALATNAAQFQTSVVALCSDPGPVALSSARTDFEATALAYAHVEFARLGPLGVADRAERLLFWPDPKGIALKQVQAALGSKDASVLTAVSLQPKSVAMQGLVAAEFLLFGSGSNDLALATPDAAFRCGYLRSIAELVAGLTKTINAEWQDTSPGGPSAEMFAPKADAKTYRSPTEVVQQIAQVLSFGNEAIRDQRVSPILGTAEGTPRPKAALFWRSGLTAPMLRADSEGLRDLFMAADFSGALGKANAASTSNSILFELDTAMKAAGLVTSPMDAAVADPRQLVQLKQLVFVTRSLDTLFGQGLPEALGLINGFSLLDGD